MDIALQFDKCLERQLRRNAENSPGDLVLMACAKQRWPRVRLRSLRRPPEPVGSKLDLLLVPSATWCRKTRWNVHWSALRSLRYHQQTWESRTCRACSVVSSLYLCIVQKFKVIAYYYRPSRDCGVSRASLEKAESLGRHRRANRHEAHSCS